MRNREQISAAISVTKRHCLASRDLCCSNTMLYEQGVCNGPLKKPRVSQNLLGTLVICKPGPGFLLGFSSISLPPKKATLPNSNSIRTITDEEQSSGYAVTRSIIITLILLLLLLLLLLL